MDEVVFEYQLTPEECRRMLLGASPKTSRAIIIIAIGCTITAAAGAAANHEFILATVFVAFTSMCLLTRWLGPRRYRSTTLGIQEPRTVTLDGQGVVSKSESLESKYQWSHFSGTRETDEFFVFLPSRHSTGIVIPKRGLRSADDEEKLRSLLESHAPLTSEDLLIRRGLALRLLLLSVIVILVVIIYVEVRIH